MLIGFDRESTPPKSTCSSGCILAIREVFASFYLFFGWSNSCAAGDPLGVEQSPALTN
jgi:hypothetical protein